jgi:hypothetical protein
MLSPGDVGCLTPGCGLVGVSSEASSSLYALPSNYALPASEFEAGLQPRCEQTWEIGSTHFSRFHHAATEWQNPPDADVVLRAAEGKEFHAHKLILSLASSVFKDMFSAQLLSTEPNSSKLPTIDVHDPPEALEVFLQIIYPVRNPFINSLETLASVLKLADKYNADALLDTYKDYCPSSYLSSPHSLPPIDIYANLCACGREKEAEAVARSIPLASLDSLSAPLLQLMTLEHYHQLVQFVIARSKRSRQITHRHQVALKQELDGTSCDNALHQSYVVVVAVVLRSRFANDPCVRTTEALGIVLNSPVESLHCGHNCRLQGQRLQKSAEGLLGELVQMAKTLPWKDEDLEDFYN